MYSEKFKSESETYEEFIVEVTEGRSIIPSPLLNFRIIREGRESDRVVSPLFSLYRNLLVRYS